MSCPPPLHAASKVLLLEKHARLPGTAARCPSASPDLHDRGEGRRAGDPQHLTSHDTTSSCNSTARGYTSPPWQPSTGARMSPRRRKERERRQRSPEAIQPKDSTVTL